MSQSTPPPAPAPYPMVVGGEILRLLARRPGAAVARFVLAGLLMQPWTAVVAVEPGEDSPTIRIVDEPRGGAKLAEPQAVVIPFSDLPLGEALMALGRLCAAAGPPVRGRGAACG